MLAGQDGVEKLVVKLGPGPASGWGRGHLAW
jgi:hypothetical protein